MRGIIADGVAALALLNAAPAYAWTDADYQPNSIETCQNAVKDSLRDPDSAKFGDDWKAWKITSGSSPKGMSYDPSAGDLYYNAGGSVNAKNGVGGYNGAEGYYCDVVITTAGDVHARSHTMESLLENAGG